MNFFFLLCTLGHASPSLAETLRVNAIEDAHRSTQPLSTPTYVIGRITSRHQQVISAVDGTLAQRTPSRRRTLDVDLVGVHPLDNSPPLRCASYAKISRWLLREISQAGPTVQRDVLSPLNVTGAYIGPVEGLPARFEVLIEEVKLLPTTNAPRCLLSLPCFSVHRLPIYPNISTNSVHNLSKVRDKMIRKTAFPLFFLQSTTGSPNGSRHLLLAKEVLS